jgi:hypothetical protein
MSPAVIRKELLLLAAKHRPPGYLETVLAAGVDDGTFVRIPRERYQELVNEFAAHGPLSAHPPPPKPGVSLVTKARNFAASAARHVTSGPGTELKALLATIGIVASPTCKCNAMARRMDAWGPDESLAHMEEIVDVMEETAKARKLPFLRAGARQMVRLACWKARRKTRQGH